MVMASISWQVCDRIVIASSGLLMSIIFARYISAAEYGDYIFVMNLHGLGGLILHLGMAAVLTQFVIKNKQNFNDTVVGIIFIKAIIASFLIPILGVFLLYAPLDIFNFLPIFAIFFLSFGTVESWYYATENVKTYSQISLLINVIAFLIKSILIIYTQNINLVYLIILLQVASSNLTFYFISPIKLKFGGSQKLIKKAFVFLREAMPIYIGALLAYVYLKSDIVMLHLLTNSEQVAYYGIAAQLSEAWIMFPALIISILMKRINDYKDISKADYLEYLRYLNSMVVLASYSVMILVILFGDVFIDYIYGTSYDSVSDLLKILTFSSLFLATRAVFSKWLIIEKEYTLSLYSHGTGAVLNIVLNMLLIPIYSSTGAAVATLLAYFTSNFLFLLVHKQSRSYAVDLAYVYILAPKYVMDWHRKLRK